jgi:hypothetical protein
MPSLLPLNRGGSAAPLFGLLERTEEIDGRAPEATAATGL